VITSVAEVDVVCLSIISCFSTEEHLFVDLHALSDTNAKTKMSAIIILFII